MRGREETTKAVRGLNQQPTNQLRPVYGSIFSLLRRYKNSQTLRDKFKKSLSNQQLNILTFNNNHKDNMSWISPRRSHAVSNILQFRWKPCQKSSFLLLLLPPPPPCCGAKSEFFAEPGKKDIKKATTNPAERYLSVCVQRERGRAHHSLLDSFVFFLFFGAKNTGRKENEFSYDISRIRTRFFLFFLFPHSRPFPLPYFFARLQRVENSDSLLPTFSLPLFLPSTDDTSAQLHIGSHQVWRHGGRKGGGGVVGRKEGGNVLTFGGAHSCTEKIWFV